jgi:hypothetical protein
MEKYLMEVLNGRIKMDGVHKSFKIRIPILLCKLRRLMFNLLEILKLVEVLQKMLKDDKVDLFSTNLKQLQQLLLLQRELLQTLFKLLMISSKRMFQR